MWGEVSAAESGGKITFYGKDPIVPSCLRFGSMAAVTLAAKAVAADWHLEIQKWGRTRYSCRCT